MFFSAFLLLLMKSLREYTELTEGNPGSPESCRIRIASLGHPTLLQLFNERKKKTIIKGIHISEKKKRSPKWEGFRHIMRLNIFESHSGLVEGVPAHGRVGMR